MKNIELKARLSDLKAAEAIAQKIGAVFQWQKRQIDTYFRVPNGRLKLRQSEGEVAQLIAYFRPDKKEIRESQYEIVPVPAGENLLSVLAKSLGILTAVRKERRLYLYENVRIHLDHVDGLGDFLELEGVLPEGGEEIQTRRLVNQLVEQFRIQPDQIIEYSYSDLILEHLSKTERRQRE